MTNFSHGRTAESAAAEYLKANGYEILQQNYRTRYCEIDIVARRDNTIYFVEVKYRQNVSHGGGLDYITPKKLKQMSFAAQLWLSDHDWSGDYSLAAIELEGEKFEVTNFLEEL